MTRATVSKHDVAKALEEFRRQGLPPPGLHRLRQAIGHGSLARIKRLQTELNLERGERLTPEALAKLPDPISEAAARVWAELETAAEAMQQGIEAELGQARQGMAAEMETMREALAAKAAVLDEAEGERQRLALRLEASEGDRHRQTASLEQTRAEVERLKAEGHAHLRAAEIRQAELSAQLEDERTARKTDADVAQEQMRQLQHALDQVKSEFARTRESYLAQSSYAQAKADADRNEIETLQRRLSAQSEEHSALQAKNEALQKNLDQARAEGATEREAHAALVATKEAEANAAGREIQALQQRLDDLEHTNAALRKQHQTLERALARSEAVHQTESARAAELKAELKDALAKIETLRAAAAKP